MSEEKATEVQVEETAAEDITTDSDGASEPALSLAASAAAPTAPAYSPVVWKNGKENGTKANADNFNHMDSQIEQLTSVINAQAALIDTLQTNIAALQVSVTPTAWNHAQANSDVVLSGDVLFCSVGGLAVVLMQDLIVKTDLTQSDGSTVIASGLPRAASDFVFQAAPYSNDYFGARMAANTEGKITSHNPTIIRSGVAMYAAFCYPIARA